MPPTHQKLNDSRVANFRSFKNFDKIIDEKTVRCKCRNTVRLDHPFRTTNFERHIKSHNCILGTDNQQSLYNFFDQKQEIQAEETELREPLPCIGLFGDLYTAYATSTPAFFGGGERPEVVGKRLFPEKFPQDTPFCRKKLNKDQIQEFNTALQATATWKVDQFEGVIRSAKCEIMTTKLSGLCNECLNLQNNKELKHAIKVIPIGKIPPMVIAILPTKGDETAEKIFNILHLVLDFAQQSNINILSIGANGVRSEFNAQTQIINSAPTHIVFSDPFYNVHFKALIINGKPIVRVQDPKHAKKTARNQLFTGARLLSLGIGTARYDQLFQLAHQDQHVLLKRDVLNVDKQDDGAAYRMFHSENLAQIIRLGTIPSDMIGLFIYLFVLESHSTKWYNMQRSIISIQSYDIFISMAESLIMLVKIYQDFYLDYPLFLWEYGTEALEHIFGISRQVIADFNFYEFYKIQKRIMYRDKIVRAELINTSRDRTSAGGYVFDIDGTSLSHKIIERLRTWPSEDDFKEAIRVGYSEAIELANYSLDNSDTLEIIDNDEDDQYQNLTEQSEQNELQKESKIGKAAFEVSRLLLDESNDSNEFTDENRTTNNSMAIFSDLQYIINQKLISQKHFEMTNNIDIQDNHINQRKIRWEGRKRLATIPIAVGINVYNIIDANVSDIHPLILGGHLIIYSDKKICIAQIISINLWTNACEAGGKLVGHIPAKEVLYYFNSSPFISSQSSFFTLTEIASKVFLHFKTPEMISSLAKIFPK
ncbi:unnamed protein product [Rhizophagus irregularis]|uniref:Uncharacterized protein n=1 Tax=Rhizophagus irregularis TaxID=588596 RepID=A0A915Z8P2_9GLOM|nr:unnamed protein product [Rhizophagus irregularis]